MKPFHGTVEMNAPTARARLLQMAEEVISQLVRNPMAKVTVNVEISAASPQGLVKQLSNFSCFLSIATEGVEHLA